jgi:flagellar biosynthetic protein FliP
MMLKRILLGVMLLGLVPTLVSGAEPTIPILSSSDVDGTTTYSLSLKIVAAMTLLSFLPAILMTMTSFTRVIIVLAILRQAIGIPNVPSNQILIGLALFLTLFIMSPIFSQVNQQAIQPYIQGTIGEQQALEGASNTLREFMLKQTRDTDLGLFLKLSKSEVTEPQQVSMFVLMPAFLTSELKTAFQIGFILYLPFLIIDIVVASVLMSMGMMMLSPLVISLPFKIMLFVLVDGWTLIIGTLASSYGL